MGQIQNHLTVAPPGAQASALSSSSFSAVWLWRGNGQVVLNLTHSQITAGSRIAISASEYSTAWNMDRFIGSAAVQVLNTAPYNGGALVWLSVSWNAPLNIAISALVDP